MYLKEKHTHTERNSFVFAGSHPVYSCPQIRIQQLQLNLPQGWWEPTHVGHHLLLLKCITGKLSWKHGVAGTQSRCSVVGYGIQNGGLTF